MMTATNFDNVNLSPVQLGNSAASTNVKRPEVDDNTLAMPDFD